MEDEEEVPTPCQLLPPSPPPALPEHGNPPLQSPLKKFLEVHLRLLRNIGRPTNLPHLNHTKTTIQSERARNKLPIKMLYSADSLDPNEEYYGVANTSEMVGGEEKPGNENDPSGVSSTTPMDDKDYRMAEEGALADQDLGGGFGEDSDYRRMAHSPVRQDRRRRRSNSPDDYQNPREGFCRDGDDCAYSHLASDSHRRTDLCKYYQHGYCKKGLACLHLHGEYPCKAFHKGECSKEQCQYSHQALDDFTQPIFDQMMRDEELASRVSLPSHPLRRKVLLPLGPETSMNESQNSNDQSFIPPPSVVVPVLSSMPPAVMVKTEQDKVMAQTGTYGFFNPITPVSSSVSSTTSMQQQPVIPPPHLSPFSSPPNNNNNSFVLPVPHTAPANLPPTVTFTPTLPTQSAPNLQSSPKMNLSNVKVEIKPEPEPMVEPDSILSGGFNINQMLEKITQQVNASSVVEEVEDSPASPPSFFNDTSMFQDTKMIPVIQSSPSLKNDPRVKKQVESQFDQGTENLKLATSLLPPLPLSGTSATPKPTKPIDPRTKDPGRKLLLRQQAGPFEEFSLEKLVQKQIQMANKLAQDSQPHTTTEEADVDHRPAFGGAASSQSQHHSVPSNGSNTFAQPSLTTTGFGNASKFPVQDPAFANLSAFEPPPFTNPGFQAPAGASPNQYGGQHTSYYSEPNDFSRGGDIGDSEEGTTLITEELLATTGDLATIENTKMELATQATATAILHNLLLELILVKKGATMGVEKLL
uniref:C3H1-type domain-containing protein n=1 Tax=Ditylenchus dipsaci TaxID=166011 RepID=A0A915EML8_9BILA